MLAEFNVKEKIIFKRSRKKTLLWQEWMEEAWNLRKKSCFKALYNKQFLQVKINCVTIMFSSWFVLHKEMLYYASLATWHYFPILLSDKFKFTNTQVPPTPLPDSESLGYTFDVVQANSGVTFEVILRFDTEVDILYYKNGGILNYMVRKMLDWTPYPLTIDWNQYNCDWQYVA